MNIVDDNGYTLLHKAASQDSFRLVEYLITFISKQY